MQERLLQFIWQFQYYNTQQLQTTRGETLVIERPGAWNHHQGPDFSGAIVRIGTTKWAGNIELHVRSSDWHRHKHGSDGNYSNIILHVVWEDDTPVSDRNGNPFPTLVLQPLIPKILLERYSQMMETMTAVPCQSFLPAIDHLNWCAWKERLAAERLERKSANIFMLLQRSGQNWEETCWWLLAANFGIRTNSALFEGVAQSISFTILSRHRNQLHQLEAMLLGQANLLAGKYTDSYAVMLQKEYRFFKKKYNFSTIQKAPAFLRMRPASFPTVRLAQLAMLLHTTTHLFSLIKEENIPEKILRTLQVTANDYWHYHYRFDEATAFQPKQLGRQMAENIFINTIIPLLFAYGLFTKDESYKEKATNWLYALPSEQNHITKQWQQYGISNKSSLDSQALIELTNHYCARRLCLDCAVGNGVFKKSV